MTDETDLTERELAEMWAASEPAEVARRPPEGWAEVGAFEVYRDATGEYRWRLESADHEVVADSNEGYRSKAACLSAITLVRRLAAGAQMHDVA